MDLKAKKDAPSKKETAGLLSKLFFLWMIPLFRKGNQKDIGINDLNNVTSDNVSDVLTEKLETEWNTECKKASVNGKRPKFLIALLKSFGTRYILFISIFMFDACVVRTVQPICVKFFIRSFSDDSVPMGHQALYAAGIVLTTFLHVLFVHPTIFQILVSGMRCRVAASSLIFRKTLLLSKAAQGKSTTGQIVNLLTNDVSRFDYNLYLIAFIFVGPVQTLIFFYLLYEELGLASVVGVGYVLMLSPGQFIIGKLSAIFRREIAEKTDERSRIMNEIILGVRLIKMYAWEKPFAVIIHKIRLLEFKALKKRSLMRSAYMGVYTSNFTFIPFLAIISYGLLGNDVTADKAFFTVVIFHLMAENMTYFAPNACACVGEVSTSIKRLEEFLLLEENNANAAVQEDKSGSETKTPYIRLNEVSASWDGSEKPTLDKLTMNFEQNQLVMVCGSVGAGKTSLLQLVIRELPVASGTCDQFGSTAYASQEAWIFPGSIRQNILFGRDFDEHRYNDIVDVCALEEDMKQFPYGDLTLVGERGISLSGGQKARINLARALYQSADIYLLDDPLSAVDAAVSRHIFDRCVNKYLKGYLRILVTHQLQYLPQADHILVLHQGSIAAQGTYNELVERGIDFVSLLARESEEGSEPKEEDETMNPDEIDLEEEIGAPETQKALHKQQQPEDEVAAKGAVSASTYWNYFRAGDSFFAMALVALGYIVNQTLITSTDYWLSLWTNAEETQANSRTLVPSRNSAENISVIQVNGKASMEPSNKFAYDSSNSGPKSDEWDQDFYMKIYACLAVAVFIVDTARAIYLFMYTMKITNNIHSRMFHSLVRAPVKFFDENPSGRIMNRFTKDIGALDEYLPLTIFDTGDIGFRMLGILVIVVISNYYIILPVIVIITVFSFIRRFYVRTARNIKRVEAITRSPLFTHLSSSLQGLSTIRASKSQNILITQFDSLQDVHSAAWYHFLAATSWFAMWLEISSVLFIAVVTFSFLATAGSISSGTVGVAMACMLQIMNIFQFGMRQSAETENLMTSVERTLEYTKLAPEPNAKPNQKNKSLKGWPTAGQIKFSQVHLTYDGKKEVLKNLNFEINAKEKIGIVGRTGAGKSSIITALFRLTEITGGIIIDGLSVNEIPLKRLRRNISIIPQDPVLFSGTIRYNLDPFDKFTDEQLWQVLEEVELKDLVTALDFQVREEGSNFSVGQRQLVCLARAILRKNKILVLDEATANVDPGTDNLIQQTIRKKFSECTILTIAHRLQSVMDCDRILVMSAGSLMEYDHPHMLLQNAEGYLTKMISHTGSATENYLREIAQKAFQDKNQRSG